jgi:hypothetical protein
MPAVVKVRHYFRKYFGHIVYLYDAFSHEKMPASADSCESTRYIVVAVKN